MHITSKLSFLTTLLGDRPKSEAEVSRTMGDQLGAMLESGEFNELSTATRCVIRGLRMALHAQAERLKADEGGFW